MELEINHAEGIDRSAALEETNRSMLQRLEPRYGDRLTRICVFLKDINAGKGGIDKVCTIEARPTGHAPIVAEAEDADLYAVVRAAEGKLERVLEHRLTRSG